MRCGLGLSRNFSTLTVAAMLLIGAGCSGGTKTGPTVTDQDTDDAAVDAGIDGSTDQDAPTADVAADADAVSPGGDVDAGSPGDTADTIGNTCTSDDQCKGDASKCLTGYCNAGTCDVKSAADGTTCDDGKECTGPDKCTAGTCAGVADGSACVKKDDKGNPLPCWVGQCKADFTCDFVGAQLGSPCDDGSLCTENDGCVAGHACNGTPKNCDDGKDCTTDSCDLASGCSNTVDMLNLCSDGNACTAQDACAKSGECVGAKVVICDDSNPCTIDTCDPKSGCKFSPAAAGAACQTNDLCQTAAGVCNAGQCKGQPNPAVSDGNDCTTDNCTVPAGATKAVITHAAANGASCDDGDPCTKVDTCVQDQCQGAKLVCNDGNSCTEDQCDPLKCATDSGGVKTCGLCAYAPLADGATCTDNNLCTSNDACQTGACKGTDWATSGQCEDKNDCTSDTCQPGSGCQHNAKDLAACNDGNPCTIADKCAGSSCQGSTKDCADTNKCTKDSCNVQNGACAHDTFVGPCDDGDACTSGDLCVDGTCGGVKLDCNDNNPCTNDICDTKQGCIHANVGGGTPCDDGFSCTSGDQCDTGKCIGGKDTCVKCATDGECKQYDDTNLCNGQWKCMTGHPTLGKVCSIDTKTIITCDASKDLECAKNTCDPNSGSCSVIKKNVGVTCSAGDKCVQNATCQANGSCVGIPVVCDDKNPCTTDSCNKILGCGYTAVADATTCDDNNVCTPSSACKTGKCIGSENTCKCKNDAACAVYDDGDLCNGVQACLQNPLNPTDPTDTVCQQKVNSVVNCPALAGQPCNDNLCNTKTGLCAPVAKVDGLMCDDSNACTFGETCSKGVCSAVAVDPKILCDDKNLCTVDVCDKVFGCANAPLAQGGLCNDSNACTQNDNCDVNGICAGAKVNCDDQNPCTIDVCDKVKGCSSVIQDGSSCDDGNPCTVKDSCINGACAGSALDCNDKDPCTVDACDGNGGCKHVSIDGQGCNDGDACTTGDICTADKCVGKAIVCDDGNACTVDACKNGACGFTVAVGTPCDDGSVCTTGDACDAKGTCSPKIVLDCKTGSACIVNFGCSPTTGCINQFDDTKVCDDGDACTQNDHCKLGGCQGTTNGVCPDDNNVCTVDSCDSKVGCLYKQNTCDDKNPCTVDTCDKVLGCQHENVDGAKCDDGNKCHQGGQCFGAQCQTVAVTCDDKNTCTIDSCDVKLGCVFTPADPTTVTCDDGNPCTDNGCDLAGTCTATNKVCDDGNPCTADSCNALKGCVTSDLTDNTKCDDGDGCTTGTVCQGGICSGGIVSCSYCNVANGDKDCAFLDNNNKCDGTFVCALDKNLNKAVCTPKPEPVVCDSTGDLACSTNTCNPASGKCEMLQSLNGSKCSDGLGCTVGDSCNNGVCVAGQPNSCAGVKDACNDAKCLEDPSPAGFVCIALPKDGSPACDSDGSGCTANDFCAAGKCQKGAAVDCSGVAKACQVAACKSTGTNSFTCAVTLAVDGTPCDDGQLCTEGDACKAGQCTSGTKPHDCSGMATLCANGACDKTGNAGTGACVPVAKNEGGSCNADDNGCTVGDICLSGTCVPGQPPNDCDSLTAACATGACKSTGGATYTCVGAPKKDKLPCEADNNGCTVGDSCAAGACKAGTAQDCSAKTSADGCLVGTCKSLGASANTCITAPAPIGQSCNSDNNGCTKGDACNKDGACLPGPAVDCLAFTGTCSTGVCQSKGASTFVCNGNNKPDGTSCDADTNGCTVGDKCTAGKCVPGAAPDCSAKAGNNVCMTGTCLNAGSDKYQCDAASLKDGTACNADKNGCTVDDSCQLGFCTKGDLQTCSAFSGLCGDAACNSTGDNTYKCDVTAKPSYPALVPPVSCTPTDSPTKCATGYACTTLNKDAVPPTGQCDPTVTVYCDDGDACTQADACFAGACKSGQPMNCDDKDPCTLDACKAGKCTNTVIAGCSACVMEKFDQASPPGFMTLSDEKAFISWAASDKAPYAGTQNYRVTWKGPPTNANKLSQLNGTLRYRRIYVDPSVPPQLDFYLSMTVSNQNCGVDDFQLLINNQKIMERCTDTDPLKYEPNSKYEHVTLDLTPYAGSYIDLNFVAAAGVDDKTSGTIDIDNLRMTGMCGPGCMGMNFEPDVADPNNPPADPFQGSLLQPTAIAATSAAYLSWAPSAQGAHSFKTELLAKYTGLPTGGKAQTTTFTVPLLRPVKNDVTGVTDKLYFAIKSTNVGDQTCGADDLTINLGNKVIYKRCDNTNGWKVESVDLADYASQTLDLTVVVNSGAGAGSSGTFEIDDIAIAGSCTYGCFVEHFNDSTVWETSSTDNKSLAPWKILASNPPGPTSPANAMYAGFDKALTPALKSNAMTTASYKKGFAVSVLGGTWAATVNVSTSPTQCALALRMCLVAPTTDLTKVFGDLDGNYTVGSVCNSTNGWTNGLITGDLKQPVWGMMANPCMVIGHPDMLPAAKAYVDDWVVMCN